MMKVHLLTMAALAWASSAMAGDWEVPVAPSDANATPIVDGGHYYATPVGTGKFLRGSNSWGTQGSLDVNGYEVIMKDTVDVAGNPGWGFYFPVVKGGDFLFTEANPANMFCDAYNGSNTLSEGRGHITYIFTLNEDGKTYRITHHYAAEVTDDGGPGYLGWDGVTLGESNVPKLAYLDPNSTMVRDIEDEDGEIIGEEEVSPFIDWAFIPVDMYAAYEAKVKLYDKLNDAEEAGVQLDDIVALYNDPNASSEDLLAAITTLTERIMNQGPGEDGVDVTDTYIKNADCASHDGWTGLNTQNSHYEGEDGAMMDGGFLEVWKNAAALDDNLLTQTINVPAGKYRLEADILATWQPDDSQEIEGVHLYADAGAGLYVESEPVSTLNERPKKYTVEFTTTGETKIGLKITDTNANWVAIDNFKLFFMGYIDNPNEIALAGVIPTLEAYEDEDVVFSAASKDELKNVIAKCEAGKGGTEESMGALVEEAAAFIAQVEKEIAAYKKLADFAEKVEEDADEYTEYGKLGEWLGGYASELVDHISDADVTIEWIEEAIAAYDEQIVEGVHEYIRTEAKPGTDVSVLIKNRDMDEGDHWVNTWGNPQIPGWHPDSNSPWGYDQSAGEFWNKNFDFYQDIEGLPAGKYTVSFQGFYRWGDPGAVVSAWLDNPDDESLLTAVLYGNSVETTFKSICEGRVTDGSGVACGEDEDGNPYYIPNSMQQAQWIFTNHPDLYHTEATALVGPDGHLRIGIKGGSDIDQRWVIFDSFRLRYDGNDADLFFDDMKQQVEKLAEKRELALDQHSLPQDLYDEIDALVAKCDALVGNAATTSDECLEFFESVNAANAKLQEVATIIAGIKATCDYYENAINEEEHWAGELVSDKFMETFDELYNIVGIEGGHTECEWETLAKLQEDARVLDAMYVSDIFSHAGADVSASNPYDMTAAIRNPQLQMDEYGYTEDEDMGVTTGAIYQWNGSGNAKREWGLAEVWNGNFDINQTLVNLPVGYYSLEVEGFYRFGTSDTAAHYNVHGGEYLASVIYAQQGENTYSTPFMSICEGAREQLFDEDGEPLDALKKQVWVGPEDNGAPEDSVTLYVPNTQTAARAFINAGRYKGNKLVFHSDGSDVKIGIKKDSLTGNDWTIFDNFKLYYLGQVEPDAIEAIKGSSTGAGVQQAIFTVGGVQVARPQRGVNIIVTTLSDGTRIASKVLVK